MSTPGPTPPPASDASDAPRGGRGSLRRRLVVQVTALVALVAVLLSLATALASRALLMNQVDEQLDAVTIRQRRADTGGQPGGGLLQPGQPIGTLSVAFTEDGRIARGEVLTEDGRRTRLQDPVVGQLSEFDRERPKRSIRLEGLGRYRIATYDAVISTPRLGQLSGTVVVGIPLENIDRLLAQLVRLAFALSLGAIVIAAVASTSVVDRSLRPLFRVAATAQQVSRLRLDRGDVGVKLRVPAEDADLSSEVGQVGQAFNHMLTNVDGALAARQASETKVRQFVADASHELRNPLAAIRGYAELTRHSRDELPADTAYAMSRVESEAERMSRLVDDLLLLARLDSGPDLAIQLTDLTQLVVNAVSDARVAGSDHVWALDLPDEPVVAPADEHRLHQVLVNLLANARTHTPPGTQVQTRLEVFDNRVQIAVRDNGPGIPADIQPVVFERFTRADASRVRTSSSSEGKSTGLGLAIVAAVMAAHQGDVSVTSRPGHTEFVLTLPLRTDRPLTSA